MAYSDKVLEHYENPRNVGSFGKEDSDVGTGMVGAPACFVGDTLVSTPSDTGTISLRNAWEKNQVFYVWSLNLSTNQFELKLARCVKTGKKQTVVLTMDDGGRITCTPDHEVLSADGTYSPCAELINVSLKSFNKIINNIGYWQVNRQVTEHSCLVKTALDVQHPLMWTHNIDHINENKLDNRIENLQLLTISQHKAKSQQHRQSKTVAERAVLLRNVVSYEELFNMTIVEQLPRWQIGDKLGLTVDWVKELQREFGLTSSPKRVMPEAQRIAARHRKLRAGNPNFSGVSDDKMLSVGNQLYVQYGKLTNKIWRDNARYNGMPTKTEHRFEKFSRFADQAINFNHKICNIAANEEEDVFCLQVEENNNFVVVTSQTLNRHSGIVVKNCGDVMKLQIKVGKDGLIEDAKFKTYGCVISTTKVSCFDHQRAISTLRPGDKVISWNGMHFVPATIKEVHTQYIHKDQLIKLRFDGFKKTHSVVCTRDHVWWTANQQPIESQDLQVGQECFDITEQTLRQLTNVRHREDFKASLSKRMRAFNKGRDNSYLVAYHLGKQLTDEQKQLRRDRTLALHKLPEYWAAWEAGMKKRDYNLRPTGLERKFIEWFDEHSLTELSYVGDGQFWAGKSHLNPDFKVKGQRKVIEVFTEKMPEFMMARDDDTWKHARTQKFNEAGFDCLYLSVEALVANPAKVLYETQQFIHNGIKLIDTKQSIDIRDLGNCERDGDFVKVYDLSLEEGANVYFIGRVGSHNCGSAIASSSLVTEWVKGKTLDQALAIKNTHIAEELALPPVKIHCSILAEDAIKAAVEDYKQKHPTSPEEV